MYSWVMGLCIAEQSDNGSLGMRIVMYRSGNGSVGSRTELSVW